MSKKGGHHGGSWKVAYADFVTSMFALFLVLWIIGADEETRRAVEDYFQGRKIHVTNGSRSVTKWEENSTFHTIPQDAPSQDLQSINELTQALEQIRQQLKNSSDPGDDQIRFDFTSDGVRINVIDKSKRPFFDPNSSNLTPFGSFVLQTIGWQLERLPVQVEVEGHTENNPNNGDPMQPWTLSSERALSSEKALTDSGVKPDKFFRVAGKGATDPLDAAHPESENNRRITIVVRPAKGRISPPSAKR